MDLKQAGWAVVRWVHEAQRLDKWLVLAKAVVNLGYINCVEIYWLYKGLLVSESVTLIRIQKKGKALHCVTSEYQPSVFMVGLHVQWLNRITVHIITYIHTYLENFKLKSYVLQINHFHMHGNYHILSYCTYIISLRHIQMISQLYQLWNEISLQILNRAFIRLNINCSYLHLQNISFFFFLFFYGLNFELRCRT